MMNALKGYAALNVAAVVAMPGLFVASMKKCIVFAGRASRLEFCSFLIIFWVIGYALDAAAEVSDIADIIGGVLSLAMLLALVSVSVRRLHDFGASGWWCVMQFFNLLVAAFVFFYIVPLTEVDAAADVKDVKAQAESVSLLSQLALTFLIIGIVINIILWFVLVLKGGDKGDNKYGAEPKAVSQTA